MNGKKTIEDRAEEIQRMEALLIPLQTIIRETDHALVVVDPEGLILFTNPAAERLFGRSYQEFIGAPFPYPLIKGQITEMHIVGDDGHSVVVEIDAVDVPWSDGRASLVTLTDITERKMLEKRLQQAQKLESLGRLAGGIAHDFNNLITAIMGFTDLTIRQLPEDHPVLQNILEIRKAGENASNIIRQLLAFSRRQPESPMVLNLNQVILKMENMLGRLIGEDVNMVKRLDPNLKSVFMDPGQIEQILINLTINAREAMPGGGTITFETGNTSLSPDQPHQRLGLQAGDFVRLGVHDTGTGMSEEEQQHLFEPFYTTKPFGERAGFGLATCYTIVQQNDGYITVDSTPGAGSSFVVYLPVAQSTETTESKTPDTGSQKPGTERVLLVEDDSSVRKYVSEVLRECGYSVLEAGSGIEALLLVNEHPDQRIDLLISDMVMPQMSGRGLADVLQSRYPDLKVLFISGYPPETISMRGVDSNSIALLSKPFTEDKFIGRVREILDSP